MTETKISINKQKKIDVVSSLKEKLGKTATIFLADYRGLTHQQMEQLRKTLKKVQAEFLVAKNSLIKLAISDTYKVLAKDIEKALNNPTALLISFGDGITAIKELAKFMKANQLPKIKVGLFEGKPATEAEFIKLSTLPSKDELISILSFRLKSPIFGLHYALSGNIRKLVYALNAVSKNKK